MECVRYVGPVALCRLPHHELVDRYTRLEELSEQFVTDVLPQIGGLCIQDYAALNELCMILPPKGVLSGR